MKTDKRGSAWIWIVIVLILIAVGVGIYFLLLSGNSNSCTDSDNGVDYNMKGTACIGKECVTDYCEGNNLQEYACDNRNGQADIDSKLYSCPNGCQNGACI